MNCRPSNLSSSYMKYEWINRINVYLRIFLRVSVYTHPNGPFAMSAWSLSALPSGKIVNFKETDKIRNSN